jgi:hypothetical protein
MKPTRNPDLNPLYFLVFGVTLGLMYVNYGENLFTTFNRERERERESEGVTAVVMGREQRGARSHQKALLAINIPVVKSIKMVIKI